MQNIIDLLKEAKLHTGTIGCTRRIDQAIALLQQRPQAGKFTKKARRKLDPQDCDSPAILRIWLKDACDLLDAERAEKDELLDACIDMLNSFVGERATNMGYENYNAKLKSVNKAKAAIAKAKPKGE